MPPSQDPDADRTGAGGPDLTVLDTLTARPLHEHAAIYDALHAQLQGALNQIDEA